MTGKRNNGSKKDNIKFWSFYCVDIWTEFPFCCFPIHKVSTSNCIAICNINHFFFSQKCGPHIKISHFSTKKNVFYSIWMNSIIDFIPKGLRSVKSSFGRVLILSKNHVSIFIQCNISFWLKCIVRFGILNKNKLIHWWFLYSLNINFILPSRFLRCKLLDRYFWPHLDRNRKKIYTIKVWWSVLLRENYVWQIRFANLFCCDLQIIQIIILFMNKFCKYQFLFCNYSILPWKKILWLQVDRKKFWFCSRLKRLKYLHQPILSKGHSCLYWLFHLLEC